MERRDVLYAGGLAVLGTTFAGAARGQEPKDGHSAHHEHAVKSLADCLHECESCGDHCGQLAASGKADHRETQKFCQDCAEFCAATLRIVSRKGPLAPQMMRACIEACEACAAHCEKHPDDPHMKRCAEACRDCAKHCREMKS